MILKGNSQTWIRFTGNFQDRLLLYLCTITENSDTRPPRLLSLSRRVGPLQPRRNGTQSFRNPSKSSKPRTFRSLAGFVGRAADPRGLSSPFRPTKPNAVRKAMTTTPPGAQLTCAKIVRALEYICLKNASLEKLYVR